MVHSQEFYNQYQTLYTHYRDIYGPRVAVFLQKGSFWEFYGQQDPETHAQLNSVKEFTDILGVQVNYYPGDAPGGLTGLFAGVPEDRLDKWAGRLTGLGWTVVVATQEKNERGDVVRRNVTRVLSPATHVEALEGTAAAAYVGAWHPQSDAAVAIDVASGTISYSVFKGCAAHFFQVYPPRELVVYGSEAAAAKDLYLKEDTVLYNRPSLPPHLARHVARASYMEGLFKPKTIMPFSTWLGIDHEPTLETLALLLHWIEDHYASLIVYLPRPVAWHPHDKMRIINNALHQLSMLGPNGVERLFRRPYSPPGVRALPALLSTPLADTASIRQRQEKAAWLGNAPQAPSIIKALRQLYDFPRIHRAIARGALKATGLYQLHISYSAIAELAGLLADSPFQGYTIGNIVKVCARELAVVFDKEKALKAQENAADWGFLTESAGPRSAALELDIQRIHVDAHEWLAGLCIAAGLDSQALSYRPSEKVTYVVHGTKAVLTRIDEWGKRIKESNPYRGVSVSFQKSGGKLSHPMLDTYNERLDAKQVALARTFQHELTAACIAYMGATAEHWSVLEEWVSSVDCMMSFAETAAVQGWVFPTILEGSAGAVSVRGLRHPLIQAQKTRSQLVSHDLELGGKTAGQPTTTAGQPTASAGQHYRGMLLYGINASGKSSLMKALGLAVLLAQIGSAVPAQMMEVTPYSAISTRILNQDNLWAGLSSFAVEMSELRTILTAADARTLVLGDELCSGTESVSATALVAAGIQCLLGAGSSFVLATHLHDLMKLPAITEAAALRIAHLRVHYDAVADVLVYDRTLSAGAGASNYGLTVAKALHMPPALLEAAYGFRRTLLGEDPRGGNSYNADVLMRACEVCGSALARDIEVHHIQEQHAAEASLIDSKAKWNADGTALHGLRNLVAVCQRCHDAHHAGAITIGMVKDTSAGARREVVEHRDVTSDVSKKIVGEAETLILGFTSAEILNIQKTHAMFPKLSSKLLAFQIKEAHGIEITPTQIAGLKKKKVL